MNEGQNNTRTVSLALASSVKRDQINKKALIAMLDEIGGGRLLDIGCNDGSFTSELAGKTHAAQAYGVDIEFGAAKSALEKQIRVVISDLNKSVPFTDSSFDVVVANQVIEHLYFTDDFINEVKRILKPGGTLLISTTNLAAIHYRFYLMFGRQPSCLHPSEWQFGNHLKGVRNPRHGHKSVFTFKAFKEFLKFYGFEIEEISTKGIHLLPDTVGDVFCRFFPSVGLFTNVKAKLAGGS